VNATEQAKWLRGRKCGAGLLVLAILLASIDFNNRVFLLWVATPIFSYGIALSLWSGAAPSIYILLALELLFVVPLFLGIHKLTFSLQRAECRFSENRSRKTVLALMIVYVLARIVSQVLSLTWVDYILYSHFVWLTRSLALIFLALAATRHVARIGRSIADHSIGQLARKWCVAYVIFSLATECVFMSGDALEIYLSNHTCRTVWFVLLTLDACLWGWAIVVLCRLRRTLHRHLRGVQCFRCGYLLMGLTEPRCPECGTPFDPTITMSDHA